MIPMIICQVLFHTLYKVNLQNNRVTEATAVITTLQMGKAKHQEVKGFAQGHLASMYVVELGFELTWPITKSQAMPLREYLPR